LTAYFIINYFNDDYILCVSVRSDLGERGILTDPNLASAASKQVKHEVVPAPPSKIGKVQQEAKSTTKLNSDDLIVIKSSFESELLLHRSLSKSCVCYN